MALVQALPLALMDPVEDTELQAVTEGERLAVLQELRVRVSDMVRVGEPVGEPEEHRVPDRVRVVEEHWVGERELVRVTLPVPLFEPLGQEVEVREEVGVTDTECDPETLTHADPEKDWVPEFVREGEGEMEGDRELVPERVRVRVLLRVGLTVGLWDLVWVADTVEVCDWVSVALEQKVALPQEEWVLEWLVVKDPVMDREMVGEVEVEMDTEELKLALPEVVGEAESPPLALGLMVPTATRRGAGCGSEAYLGTAS